MNSIITDYFPIFKMYSSLRDQVMNTLTDDDLQFRPTSANATLGELCREIGETERSYIESFKTWTINFDYRYPEPEIANSVEQLRAWYADLDRELEATIGALSDADVRDRVVDRGHDFKLSPQINLNVYQEALLIFYGKISVYLRALGKTPQQFREWIG